MQNTQSPRRHTSSSLLPLSKVCTRGRMIGRSLLNVLHIFPPSGDPSAEVVTNLVFVKKWHSQIFSLSSLRHPIHPPLWWPMTYFFSWWREWKLSGPWNPKPLGTVLLWSPWKVWLVALVSFFLFLFFFFFLTMLLLLILYLLCVHLSESYDEYIYKNIN